MMNRSIDTNAVRFIIISVLLIFCSLGHSSASLSYNWSSIKGCHCGLGASIVKNQSLGVLFSQRRYDDDSIGFEIDFSGVNRIAFQVDNVFYNHDNNTMRIEENKFFFPEAEQFIKLAHSYNTSVDLLISSQGGKVTLFPESNKLSAGEVVILANDIAHMLTENAFDGVTIDLDRLFNHDLISYRRLVQEIIKDLENSRGEVSQSITVIIADKDLPIKPSSNSKELETDKQKNARLLLRLLDEGLRNTRFDDVQNRLLIRTNKVRVLEDDSYLSTKCAITEVPVIEGSFQYSDKPTIAPPAFAQDRVYPLVSLSAIKKQLKGINESCREKYFNEFIIGRYQGLAFENSDESAPDNRVEISALGKWYPEFLGKLESQVTIDSAEVSAQETVDSKDTVASTDNKGGTTDKGEIIQTDAIDDASDLWADLSEVKPIADKEAMSFLKYYQEEYAPQLCQKICPYQGNLLLIAFVALIVLLLFLLVSWVFYTANTLFQKVSIYCYIGLVLLTCVIQAIALCEIKYEIVRNWTMVILFVILLISLLVYMYYRDKKGRFP